jgi:hypothetical protein
LKAKKWLLAGILRKIRPKTSSGKEPGAGIFGKDKVYLLGYNKRKIGVES